jgi:hypothetical protein
VNGGRAAPPADIAVSGLPRFWIAMQIAIVVLVLIGMVIAIVKL